MEMSGSQPSQFITSNGSRGISRGSGAPLIDDIEMGQIVVPERSGFYLSLFFAVIGTAFALNILFKIPVWCGVLLTGLSTLLLLLLQQYGVIFLFHSSFDNFFPQVRKLEFFIAFLVLTMAGCFFAELGYAKPKSSEVLKGLFVPQLKGNGATGLAISLLGAMVMP
ncbi:hypothetical protein BHM03_00036563 [Ensete ventricosum]|nr:hypothetical protein BHM03_00036563 [Ensete ventricosum]